MPGLLSPKLCGLDFDRRDPTAAFVLVKIRRLNHPRLVQQKNVHWRLEIVIQEFTVYVYEVPIHFSKQKTNDCPLPSRLCHRSPEGKEHTTQALGMKESKVKSVIVCLISSPILSNEWTNMPIHDRGIIEC